MSIRRILLNFIIMILTFTLQTTVFRVFAFGGVVPNLMLIFVTSIAFIRGDKVGLLTGFVSGFLVDIFFGAILGFYALLFMYIGFFVGKLHEVFYSQNMAIPIAIIIPIMYNLSTSSSITNSITLYNMADAKAHKKKQQTK